MELLIKIILLNQPSIVAEKNIPDGLESGSQTETVLGVFEVQLQQQFGSQLVMDPRIKVAALFICDPCIVWFWSSTPNIRAVDLCLVPGHGCSAFTLTAFSPESWFGWGKCFAPTSESQNWFCDFTPQQCTTGADATSCPAPPGCSHSVPQPLPGLKNTKQSLNSSPELSKDCFLLHGPAENWTLPPLPVGTLSTTFCFLMSDRGSTQLVKFGLLARNCY